FGKLLKMTPKPDERLPKPEAQPGLPTLQRPSEGGPQVVSLSLEPLHPKALCFGQRQEELRVLTPDRFRLPVLRQALLPDLPDHLQHREPNLAVSVGVWIRPSHLPEQALIDQ